MKTLVIKDGINILSIYYFKKNEVKVKSTIESLLKSYQGNSYCSYLFDKLSKSFLKIGLSIGGIKNEK